MPGQLAVAAVILVLAWPIRSTFPRLTIDISWQLGLHQAVAEGLRFGRDIVFTYGPLGFLAKPTPFIGPTSALAFIATAAIYLALIGLLLRVSLRLVPLWAALLVTLAFARAFNWLEPFEALQILAFGLGVEVLRRDTVSRPLLVAVVAGLLAGFAMLAKVNVGVFVSAMAFIVVLAVARPRLAGVVTLAVSAAATIAGLWLVAGQQLSDLVPYIRNSEEIIAGYSEAMPVSPADAKLVYLAFFLVAAVIAAVAYRTAISWPRARRLALGALVVLLLFACWKFAFVRSHIGATFAMLAFSTLILLPTTLRRSISVPILLGVGLVFLVVLRFPIADYANVATSSVALRDRRVTRPSRGAGRRSPIGPGRVCRPSCTCRIRSRQPSRVIPSASIRIRPPSSAPTRRSPGGPSRSSRRTRPTPRRSTD